MRKPSDLLLSSGSRALIDRRSLIKAAGVMGLGAAVSPLIVPRPARAASKGGHLKMGSSQGSTTDSIEPGTYENGFTIMLSYTIQGKLTIVGPDNQLHGDLAESWEAADGAKKWTFKLRDAEFHNGKPVRASDVVASLNHHRGADTKSAAKPIMANVKDIKADGDKTVVVELNSGDADFPYIVTDYQLCICMADDAGKIDWNDDGSRSGPYKLKEYNPGVRAAFEKAANHWNKDVGFLDSAEALTIGDVTARQNALLTGEVDVIDRPDVRTLEMLKRAPNLTVEEASGFRFHGFTMFCDTPPFDNKDVRLALKYAIDREAMVKTALLGHGSIGNDQPITPAYRYYDAGLKPFDYDLDKAKFHLKKAGLSSLDVDLSASSAAFAAAVDCSVLYKSQAAPAGINLNVINEPADGYWDNVWLKKPFIATDWAGRPTEDLMFSVEFKAGAPWNDTHFNNAQFEKLLVEARAELDESKRHEMYADMQKILQDDGGIIIPMIPNNIWAFNKKVKHAESISKAMELDGWQFISRWWIEA
ncbi:MAG TPA: ABC transporter substrate-binding protein [Dongiaceae bacterium]|nr:ABC transporter substrate-binding protein [Dongiaceae bacterium]